MLEVEQLVLHKEEKKGKLEMYNCVNGGTFLINWIGMYFDLDN